MVEALLGAGSEGVDGGQQLSVVGVEFVSDGEIAGADTIADLIEFVVQFGAGNWVGRGGRRFAGEEPFSNKGGTGKEGGDSGPGFGGD